jgi:dipeptidyl aminopeptidase/acylaminoacyl peptidase
MRGHGALAVVSDHHLYLVGGDAGDVQRVTLDGRATKPLWSADGRWLAVTVSPAPPKKNPYADLPTSVRLVSAAGKVIRTVSPPGAHDAVAHWSPNGHRLAITYRVRRRYTAEVVRISGNARLLTRAGYLSGVAWSPDGSRIAVGVSRFRKPATATSWRSEIDVYSPRGSKLRMQAAHHGGIIEVTRWWPDGSGVLGWIDPMGSGSIAADGLPLYDFTADGHRRKLGGMLAYAQWLATSRATNQVALIAGGDRELTLGHKHLVICDKKTCRPVMQKSSQVSFDPAWSESGRLAFVTDQAVSPSHGIGVAYIDEVQASGGLALLFPQRRSRATHLLSGAHASDPVWGRPGDGSMLVVRKRSLWLLTDALNHATRVAGPIDVSANTYYGFVPWDDSFAWSFAVPQ